jgi:hypothetical protein
LLLVAGLLAGEAGGADAWPAAERLRGDPRVVGDRHRAGRRRRGARLGESVVGEGLADLGP